MSVASGLHDNHGRGEKEIQLERGYGYKKKLSAKTNGMFVNFFNRKNWIRHFLFFFSILIIQSIIYFLYYDYN